MKTVSRITSFDHELFYHCVTRNVAGQYFFGNREKAVFHSMMRKVADFCGIEILTYCLMSNHIHILCRVPPRNRTHVSDEELLRRYRVLFTSPSKYRPYNPEVLEALLKSGSEPGKMARKQLLNRMHNVSKFMKILKLRFSIWFNKTHGRYGTLWAEKFKSIVVEGRGNPLLRMAQYIDLNPVRAGIANQSEDHSYCGIADAKTGSHWAEKGIKTIVRLIHPTLPPQEAVAWYRAQLKVTLRQRPGKPRSADSGASTSQPRSLLEREDRFSKSLAMGSREFLRFLMQHFGPAFSPKNLKDGPPEGGVLVDEEIFYGRRKRPLSS